MAEKRQLNIIASGRVQGTFFRANAKRIADGLGLTGFAKNMKDGRVTILAEGEEAGLRKLLDWCYRGSFLAKVDELSFKWGEAKGEFKDFFIDREGKTFIEDKAAALLHLSKNILSGDGLHLPKHIVIIPDGNRRWAEEKNLPIWKGHEKAFDGSLELLREIQKMGIRYCTLWGFSTENWKRSSIEVKMLMQIFPNMLIKLREEAFKEEIAVHHFGRKDRLPAKLSAQLDRLEKDTARFNKYYLGIALDYGGRDEIIRAMEKVDFSKPVSELDISNALDTNGFPDPELIIRTGGEQRLSGMMPWQSVYAELYFSPLYYPDFGAPELHLALQDFSNRHRRFGK